MYFLIVKYLTIITGFLFLTGCGRQPEIREYVEVVQMPPQARRQVQQATQDPMRAAPLSVEPVPENMPADHPTLTGELADQLAAASASGPNAMRGRESEVPPPPAAGDLTWTLPRGWTERPGSGMRVAEFTPDPDVRDALVTLIALGPVAGTTEANIQRWRQQVGLPPQGESETLEVQGREQFTFVTFARESRDAGLPQTTSAAIYVLGDRTIFLKFTGPTEFVTEHKIDFLELAGSLTLQPDEDA